MKEASESTPNRKHEVLHTVAGAIASLSGSCLGSIQPSRGVAILGLISVSENLEFKVAQLSVCLPNLTLGPTLGRHQSNLK